MIVFENRGEIDPVAMTTFGVSVKVGDNPIGFFGTGLKYAVAVLLRTGHKVTVYSGEDRMRFSSRRGNVRGKDFEFVEMAANDAPPVSIGFTTELGKTWEPWMAYRELYCNTRDEGGEVYLAASGGAATDPRTGLTQIRVEGDGIERVHADHAQYFIDGEPDLVVNDVGIYRRPSNVLFYRGIRVLKLPKSAAFTYNLTGHVELTEDRTMAHPFMATYYLGRALAKCEDPEILEAALTASSGDLERDFDYQQYTEKPTQFFLDTVGRLASVGSGAVAPSAVSVWNANRPAVFVPEEPEAHWVERGMLKLALEKCRRFGFGDYPVKVASNVPDGAHAIISGGCIYIAYRLLSDEETLLRTIIEQRAEAAAQDDPSREPVDFLLDALVVMVRTDEMVDAG